MPKPIKLTKKERGKLWLEMGNTRTAVEILTTRAAKAIAEVDPDLPGDVRARKQRRIRDELRAKVDPMLAQMRERATLIRAQREFYTREAVLRTVALDAPPTLHQLAASASPGQLRILAEEAAASGNLALSGAVAWALAGREVSAEDRRAVSEALDRSAWPDLSDVEEMLRQACDAYVKAELLVIETTMPPDGARRKMELGQVFEGPVLPVLVGDE